jgi:hypothetical protein
MNRNFLQRLELLEAQVKARPIRVEDALRELPNLCDLASARERAKEVGASSVLFISDDAEITCDRIDHGDGPIAVAYPGSSLTVPQLERLLEVLKWEPEQGNSESEH